MRDGKNEAFVTVFWRRAYESLPAQVRAQYFTQIKAAESWELALGDLIKLWSRAKNAVLKILQTPRAKRA
jgi:hypothetical protein